MEAGDEYIETGGGDVETGYALGTARINDLGGTPSTDYYHTDMLGTTRFLTDASGGQIEPAVYTAFGELVSGTSGRFGYVGAHGYQTSDEMPYQHVGNRYYDPTTGRFLQRDTIGTAGGINVYAYTNSHPTLSVDPDGEFLFALIGVAVLVITSATAYYYAKSAAQKAADANRDRHQQTPHHRNNSPYEDEYERQRSNNRQQRSNVKDFAQSVQGIARSLPEMTCTGYGIPPAYSAASTMNMAIWGALRAQ